MPQKWVDLPLNQSLYTNVDEDAVVGFQTGLENGFLNEFGGQSRFPGLRRFATLPGDNGRVYLYEWNNDLIAATSNGQVYRIDRSGTVKNITAVPLSGGRRTIFTRTDRELLMASGGSIIRVRSDETEILSDDAPQATHVAWIDGYTLAVEVNSGRLNYSDPGQPAVWPGLNTFAADGNPDNINSMIITPFREILLGGQDSIEQFERVPNGDPPFFKRWAIGDGVKLPYTQVFADNAVWNISGQTEFVRSSGQISQAQSGPIGKQLEAIDDWTDAWIGGYPDKPLHIIGQKFILIQAPNATNKYGTKGITLLYDYANQRWSELFGWNSEDASPVRWPGWSHWPKWDKVFVGGEGTIFQLDPTTHLNDTERQRWLVQTSHIATAHEAEVSDFRIQVKRGVGTNDVAPSLIVRCSRDGEPFSVEATESLGLQGDRYQYVYYGGFGCASTFRFEITTADDCDIELIKVQAKITGLGY